MQILKKIFLNSKGNAFLDTLTVLITIFVFGVITIFGYTLLSNFNDDLQTSDVSNLTKVQVDNLTTDYPSFMDYAFITALVLLWIASIIFSFMVDSHPIFLVITVILLLFVMFMGGILSNSYNFISEESGFSSASFPITNFVLNNLLLVVVFFGVSISVSLYAKNRSGGL